VLSIFLILGLDVKGKSTGQLNQVLTGEGKSITLALTATLYALLNVNINVICFSEYLTYKDDTQFDKFFKSLRVDHLIKYSTILKLVESMFLSALPNFREQVLSFLKGQSVTAFTAKTEQDILLIDEVDVFFGPDFYGQLFSPARTIKSSDATHLCRFMWENRSEIIEKSQDEAVDWILEGCSESVHGLLKEYPRLMPLLKIFLIECQISLRANFRVNGVCGCDVVCQDDRIGYLDRRIGSVNYAIVGPNYMFAHYFYHEKVAASGSLKISEKSLCENSYISFTCGHVLYSELPNFFRLIHGVSGTLSGFSEGEKQILMNYGFTRSSFIPSTFEKKTLEDDSDLRTSVWIGDKNMEYFDKIKSSIVKMVKKHRATLVFFDTIEELEWFRIELEKKPIKLPNFQAPEVLSENLTTAQRDGVISRAIRTSKVTLSTKVYMRGTDFKCRDTQLSSNGGVHVIVTFYPETYSDHIQVQGRTCRQSDPGSFQLVLFADHLVAKNLLRTRKEGGKDIPDVDEPLECFPVEKEEFKRWDMFLGNKRNALAENRTVSMKNKLETNKPRHDKSLQMSRLMPLDGAAEDGPNIREAAELLRQLNL